MTSILSKYLKSSLLLIVDDDEKLADLEKASKDILSFLIKNPSATQRFVIAGLDSTVAADDPVHLKVAEAAETHWRTIAARLGNEPRQVYRAIILTALEEYAELHPYISGVILLAAANLNEDTFGKGEAPTIQQFLHSLEVSERARVEQTWAAPQTVTFPLLSGKPKKIATINKEDLATGLSKAVGPIDKAGRSATDANPYFPDDPQSWANFFADKAAEVIHKAITSGQKISNDENAELLKKSLDSLSQSFNEMALREAKSELLWIKESSYSPSGRKHFSELSGAELSIYATIDVSRSVGPSHVPSVEWFLHDLIAAYDTSDVGIEKALESIQPILSALPEANIISNQSLPSSGRRTLLEVCLSPESGATFENQTGFTSTQKESLSSFTRRIYRELLAAQIANL